MSDTPIADAVRRGEAEAAKAAGWFEYGVLHHGRRAPVPTFTPHDQAVSSLFRREHPRPGDRPQPQTSAAQAAAITASTGETMSLADTLRTVNARVETVAAEIETVGDDVLADVKVIAANPLTAPALEWLAALAGINIDPAVLTKGLGAIEALHIAYTPAAQQQTGVEAGQQAAGAAAAN